MKNPTILLALSLVLLLVTNEAAFGCDLSDIDVSGVRSRTEYQYVIITGTIKNNCSTACGVQLKATLYDKDGIVLDTSDFYPAGTANIPARSDFPFKAMLDNIKGGAKVSVTPLSVQGW
jgi:hypothetical protein